MKQGSLTSIFEDDDLLAVHKPSGWFVHPTSLDYEAPNVWDTLDQKVLGVHRLDRATSGVLLFAKTREAAQHVCEQFRQHTVEKTYEAIVRGFIADPGEIINPVVDLQTARSAPAHTRYRPLETYVHPVPFGRYESARFTRLELKPLTGRRHQLRRHMAHVRHPILGDTTYGDNKLNRHMSAQLGWSRLLLFAVELQFLHPRSGERLTLRAPSDFCFPFDSCPMSNPL